MLLDSFLRTTSSHFITSNHFNWKSGIAFNFSRQQIILMKAQIILKFVSNDEKSLNAHLMGWRDDKSGVAMKPVLANPVGWMSARHIIQLCFMLCFVSLRRLLASRLVLMQRDCSFVCLFVCVFVCLRALAWQPKCQQIKMAEWL